MQILHCTDFHANKAWFDWLVERSADYSLACVTGDFLNLFEMHQVEDQVRMVKAAMPRMKCPLALCTGNHDSFTGPPAPEYLNHATWLSAVRGESVWLDGDMFRIGTSQFRCVGWNATLPPANKHEIWLFHAPPARSLIAAGSDESDAGDEFLGEVCRAGKGPRIVLSGHQHNPRRWMEKVGHTWCFNPGVNRDAAFPNHIVIDLLAETATLRINDQDRASVCIR